MAEATTTKRAEVAAIVPSEPKLPASPMEILELAVTSGASVDVLERLMALSDQWSTRQAERAFTAALSDARADLPKLVKGREVDFSTPRGRTHYRYEDLASVVDAVAPVLARHGLSFRWRTDSTQRGLVAVTCILSHKDGHAEETTLAGPYDESGNKNAIQAIGSVVTYLQRYTLKAALGVAAADDDDGRSAGAPVGERREEPREVQGRRTDAPTGGKRITKPQASRLWALAYKEGEGANLDRSQVESEVRAVLSQHGYERTEEVTMDSYEAVVDAVQSVLRGLGGPNEADAAF